MTPAAGLAFGFLEEFSKSAAERANDSRKELEDRVAAALEDGYQRGYAAGRSEVQAEADNAIRQFSETCAAEKIAVQAMWQQDVGSRLADIVESGISELSQRLEHQLAELVKPWLLDRLHDSAMQGFLEAIDRIVIEGVSVDITGPQPLVSAVVDRIGGKATVAVSHCEDDASVVVKTNGAVVSANFEAWMSRIRETANE